MGFFLGCCVIAAVLWYFGRRVVRLLFSISIILGTIGKNAGRQWPSDEEFTDIFRAFKG